MSLIEGTYAFVPHELAYGKFERTRQYDSESDSYFNSITLTDRSGKKQTFPEQRAAQLGLRGPLPLPVAELMLNVIGSRTSPVIGGSLRGRMFNKYPPMQQEDRVFGAARILRDLEERYRRSVKKRRAEAKRKSLDLKRGKFYRITATDFTPEDTLRHSLARYIAAELAGSRAATRGTPVTNVDFDQALQDVDAAMMFGSTFTLQTY